ncbi:MAG: hypothetical protein P9M08_04815 [Candidatus Erginobacter occultus]|nr:hypothetical protein [Candidatus Erginobacter occultus]
MLFEAWHNQRRMLGEVPAAVFGSSDRWSYNAECLPLGESGKMIVLLWLPDRQMKLSFGHRGLM